MSSETDLLDAAPPAQSVDLKIAASVRNWIVEGRYKKGENLPPEQDLAKRFRVARHTLRLALIKLEKEGLVKSLGKRRGRIVTAELPPASTLMSKTILVLTDAPSETAPQDQVQPGWSKFVHVGAIEAVRSTGVPVLTLNPGLLAGENLRQLLADPPLGVIALHDVNAGTGGRNLLEILIARNIPVSAYADAGKISGADTVVSDHAAGAYALTRFLFERGSKRILRFWGSAGKSEGQAEWLAARNAGFERAARESGIDVLPPIEYAGGLRHASFRENFEISVRLAAGFLVEAFSSKNPPDAIMAASDGMLTTVAAACRILGKIPNRDVALAGYDNYWSDVPERKFEPARPLATVDKNNVQIGRELALLMTDRLSGKLPDEPQMRLVAPNVVVIPNENA